MIILMIVAVFVTAAVSFVVGAICGAAMADGKPKPLKAADRPLMYGEEPFERR